MASCPQGPRVYFTIRTATELIKQKKKCSFYMTTRRRSLTGFLVTTIHRHYLKTTKYTCSLSVSLSYCCRVYVTDTFHVSYSIGMLQITTKLFFLYFEKINFPRVVRVSTSRHIAFCARDLFGLPYNANFSRYTLHAHCTHTSTCVYL